MLGAVEAVLFVLCFAAAGTCPGAEVQFLVARVIVCVVVFWMSRSTKKKIFKQKILFVGNDDFFFEIFFTKTFARIRLSDTIIYFFWTALRFGRGRRRCVAPSSPPPPSI